MKNLPILAFIGGITAGLATAALLHSKKGQQARGKLKNFIHETEYRLNQMKDCMTQHIESCKIEQQEQSQDPQKQQN